MMPTETLIEIPITTPKLTPTLTPTLTPKIILIPIPKPIQEPIEEPPFTPLNPSNKKFNELKLKKPKKLIKKQLFKGITRTKNKKIKVITEDLPYNKALQKAMEYTARTPSASFKLIPTKTINAEEDLINAQILQPNTTMFYEKKGWFIEKPKYRIKEKEEIYGIPYKGIQTKKLKKMFNKKNKWRWF